ncbi:MAG: copper resistance protein NlpE [Tannerellaceae bacterium]|nr:copper resistance protein NlpE [Tannerellaceae bacterium]MCD7915273.1 copper resistance protein NlpE [Tannerellaceae bacterium]
MKKFSIWVLALVVLAACSHRQKESHSIQTEEGFTPEEIHQVIKSPDFWGVYGAVLPLPDGSQVKIALTIHQDNTYHERLEYRSPAEKVETWHGHYVVEEALLALYPDHGETEYYRIEKDKLYKLDNEGKRLTGPDQQKYVLTKE